MNPRKLSLGIVLPAFLFLIAWSLATSSALAQTTVNATTTTGGSWTAGGWTCSPAVAPCVPNNGTPSGDTYNVGINSGAGPVAVILNSSVIVNSISITSGTSGSTILGADLYIMDGGSLTTTGDVANTGTIYVDGLLTTSEGTLNTTLNVGGSLTSYTTWIGNSNMTGTSTVNIAGTVTNTGYMNLSGGSTSGARSLLNVTDPAPSTLTGSYDLRANAGAAVVEFGSGGIAAIGPSTTGVGGVQLSGGNAYMELSSAKGSNSALMMLGTIKSDAALILRDGATVSTKSGVDLTNDGELIVGDIGASGSALNVGGSLTTSYLLQIGSSFGGGMTSASTVNVAGTLTNTSNLYLFGSSTLTATSSYTQIGGMTDVDGTLMAPTVNINGGTLSGTGTIQGAVMIGSNGTLSPGDAPGTIHITGPLSIAGTLDEALDSASIFDVTDITGELTLDSSSILDIMLGSSFDPAVGTSFTIMDFGSLASGSQFGSIENQFFNNGTEEWSLAYNPTNIVLTAESASRQPTPEPASLLLFGSGLLAISLYSLRRKQAA